MVYRAIGLMSGSSLDGLDIVFTEIQENGGKWTYEIIYRPIVIAYPAEWINRLEQQYPSDRTGLPVIAY